MKVEISIIVILQVLVAIVVLKEPDVRFCVHFEANSSPDAESWGHDIGECYSFCGGGGGDDNDGNKRMCIVISSHRTYIFPGL